MSVISFFTIAIALGINSLLLFQRCAKATPVRLSAGVLVVLVLTLVHIAMYYLGILLGNLLRIGSPDSPELFARANAYITLGLFLIVILKNLFPYLRRNPQLPVFPLTTVPSALAMAAATGINVFLLGIGVGLVTLSPNPHLILWPLLLAETLLGSVGLMFGRQKVQLRPRRWAIVSAVILLVVAVAAVVNA